MLAEVTTMRSLLVFLIATLSVSASSIESSAQTAQPGRALMPLLFEPNQGQAANSVRFLTHGSEYQALLTDDGVALLVQRRPSVNAAEPSRPAVLRLQWLGAQPRSQFRGEERQASYSNYFQGTDPSRWRVHVPHFASVAQANVRPGMDIRFYSTSKQQLEYDLSVAPELDASQVGFEIIGADAVRVDSNGDLVVQVGGAELRQPSPHAYQLEGSRRLPVAARYVLQSKNVVTFEVAARRAGRRLEIDPVLQYSSYLGGATTNGQTDIAFSNGVSTAVDRSGNVYLTGNTNALDFPTTAGAFEPQCPAPGSIAGCAGRPVVFVSKFDRSGNHLIFSTYLSGDYGTNSFDQAGKLLAVDSSGDTYIAGGAFGGFPVTPDAFQQDCAFEVDSSCAFLTKLSPDGSKLLYSTYFGNGFPDVLWTIATGLALGPEDDVYLTGWTDSSQLPTTPDSYQATCPNFYLGACRSGFVARFNTKLSGQASLVYATYLGGADTTGSGVSEGDGIAADRSGNAYVVGLTNLNSFPHSASFGSGTGPNEARGVIPFEGVTFVSKLSPDGKSLVYSTFLRGASGTSIALDALGQAFIAGAARTGFAATAGALQTTFAGGSSDAFVTKLSIRGNALQYSTFIGGSASDLARDIAVNNHGIAFVTGRTDSANFPIRAGAFKWSHSGVTAFVTAVQNDGKGLYYSSYLGGSKNTVGSGIAMDPAWNAYVVGTTADTDFPVTPQAYQATKRGSTDAFWSRIVIAGDLRASLSPEITSVAPNGVVNFRGRITNFGPDGSDNVVFTNAIPKGMAYAGVYSANGDGCSKPTAGATSGSLICHKVRLEKGQTFYVNVYLRAIAPSGSTVRDTVQSSAQTQDLWTSNNSAVASVQIH
jgi:uncharacterized repeat protein (TIGR01451 family)